MQAGRRVFRRDDQKQKHFPFKFPFKYLYLYSKENLVCFHGAWNLSLSSTVSVISNQYEGRITKMYFTENDNRETGIMNCIWKNWNDAVFRLVFIFVLIFLLIFEAMPYRCSAYAAMYIVSAIRKHHPLSRLFSDMVEFCFFESVSHSIYFCI